MAALTGLTVGTPDNSYLSLIKFTDNLPITASLKALTDGQGNAIGIKFSTTQVSIDNALVMSSLAASKLVYLNASKELVTIADGTAGQVLQTNGAGVYTFATVAGGGGITINTTTIASGTSGRLLYDNAGTVGELDTATYPSLTELSYVKGVTSAIQTQLNAKLTTITVGTTTFTSGTTGRIIFDNGGVVGESAGLTYASGLFTVLGTTQQAKFAYDASNHLGITISSVGHAQLTLTGTSPTFRINNAVSINTSAQPTSVLDVKYTAGGIDTLKLTDTGNWIISFYQGATQRAGFDNYGRTWNTLGGNAIFNSGTGTIAFYQNSVTSFTSIGTGAVSGTLQLVTGFVGVGVSPTVKLHVLATTEQIRSAYDASNYASFTTGATGSLTIALTGTSPRTTFSQGVTMGGTLRLTPYTVATLPSGVVGDTAYVTDATLPTYLGALTGGGAVTCPVFYNGSAWVSA